MPTSRVTSIMDDLKTTLEGVAGVAKVYKVGRFSIEFLDRVADTDYPVILLSYKGRAPLGESKRPRQQSSLRVAILAVDKDAAAAGDDDWSAERAEELEYLIHQAVLADRKRSALAYDTAWLTTTPNPADLPGLDCAVGLSFEVRHNVRSDDLSADPP